MSRIIGIFKKKCSNGEIKIVGFCGNYEGDGLIVKIGNLMFVCNYLKNLYDFFDNQYDNTAQYSFYDSEKQFFQYMCNPGEKKLYSISFKRFIRLMYNLN